MLEFGIIIDVPMLVRMLSMSLADVRGKLELNPLGIDPDRSCDSGFESQLVQSDTRLGSTGVVGLDPEPPKKSDIGNKRSTFFVEK